MLEEAYVHFDSKQERCEITRSLCALIYNMFRFMTHTLHLLK